MVIKQKEQAISNKKEVVFMEAEQIECVEAIHVEEELDEAELAEAEWL